MNNEKNVTIIVHEEIKRFTEKFGQIDLDNSLDVNKSTFFGKEYKTTEMYRSKNFTCVSLLKL